MYWAQLLNEVLNKDNQQDFTLTNIKKKYSTDNDAQNCKKPARIYKLGGEFKHIHFSQREGECMTLLLQGKTIPGTAKILGLSPRTVEFYLKNMKRKVNCRTKSELIEIALTNNFLSNLNKDDFIEDRN